MTESQFKNLNVGDIVQTKLVVTDLMNGPVQYGTELVVGDLSYYTSEGREVFYRRCRLKDGVEYSIPVNAEDLV